MNSPEFTDGSTSFSLSCNEEPFEYEGSDLEAMTAAENYPRWIVEEFAPYLRGKVADVGAGSGNFSKFLLDTDVESIHAFEPSTSMHRLLAKRYCEERRVETVNAYLSDVADRYLEAFDTIVYNNVMEHVEDDEAELESVYRMLRPGGCVLIYVPALSWLYSDFDQSLGHFRRYEKASGSDLLVKTGFAVEEVKYTDILGVLPWFLCMRVFRRKLSKGSVGLYDKLGVPLTRMIEKIAPMPIGKNLLLVGRKQWLN